jgi:hypothetical protein
MSMPITGEADGVTDPLTRFPKGTRTQFGVPNHPDQKLAQSIAETLALIPEIESAHLPMVFDPNYVSEPALVLFMVIDPKYPAHEIAAQANQKLALRVAAPGGSLNTLPMKPDDPFLYWVEKAACRILSRSTRGEPIIEHPWRQWKLLFRRYTRIFTK